MARPDDREPLPLSGDGRRGLDTPPERLRGGGGQRPAIVGIVIAAVVGIALWQPWAASGSAPLGPSSSSPAIGRAQASSALASPAASPAPSSSPSLKPGTGRTAFYTTVTDNEWTVVALLAPATPVSSEEPATQHPGAGPSDGPYLVLQQGLTPSSASFVATSTSAGPCPPSALPRDRTAVPLPAGRVAYIGVTVPSGVPRPEVTATLLGERQSALARVPAPTVRLAGMDASTRYVIPTAGPGAALLFGAGSSSALAPGAYQFTVASPGAAGDRYLYACIGS